jgi:bifunctional UDP-N-acetylglucosamine pyrophosphorylase/glucosamine-1-phosphate N-acetyltransferase
MTNNDWRAVVLAAGRGTRMRSRTPKVLHPVAGRPMLLHVTAAVAAAVTGPVVVIVPPDRPEVAAAVPPAMTAVPQTVPLGTGHALLQAKGAVPTGSGHLLVVNGDMPLLDPGTLTRLMRAHEAIGALVSIVTCRRDDPAGLGRVVRDPAGAVTGVIEERDADDAQRALNETNEGVYGLSLPWAWEALAALKRHAGGEYYVTDLVAAALAAGGAVETVAAADESETGGVNDRIQLAAAEAAMRQRIRAAHMLAGVTIVDPPSTFIDAGVTIGEDTVVLPNTHLGEGSVIGRDCRLGPGAVVMGSHVGDGCTIASSVIERSVLEPGVEVGPFSHLRPGSYIESGVHLGNYVEVKNSRIGRGSQVGHFSYLGDATLGAHVNIGAGTITCNYDGETKHETHIGDHVFIGSDTMLVAPVRVGHHAATGAGAVVTRDVADGSLVAGVPAKPRPRRSSRSATDRPARPNSS